MRGTRHTSAIGIILRRRALILGAASLVGGLCTLRTASRAQQADGVANRKAVKLAVPDFAASSAEAGQWAQEMKQLILTELKSSGHYVATDVSGVDIDTSPPPFDAWRSAGVDAVLIGRVKAISDGRLVAEFRLWDVAAQTQLFGRMYSTVPQSWRELGHVVSAEVVQRLATGKQ